jgi:hypothetical protein
MCSSGKSKEVTEMAKTPIKLLFSVEDDGEIHLHINERVIIPFQNLDEWKKFAEDMLGMMPEMIEYYPVSLSEGS